MRVSQLISSPKILLMEFPIGVSVANVGVPLVAPGNGEAGLMVCTTTAIDNMVGLAHNVGTYATAQQSDGSDPAAFISVIVNPDAILEAKLSGSATDDTALTSRDVTTASTTGQAITTGDDWSSPTMDEGVVWGISGANVSQYRKITSVSTTAATVTVAFRYDTAVGDLFSYAPIFPGEDHTVTLTTNLTQVRQDAAVATNTGALRCIGVHLRDAGNDGLTNSYGLFVSGNHVFGGVLN